VLFAIVLASVLLHEIAHGIFASHAGALPKFLVLLPIGGVGVGETSPDDHRKTPQTWAEVRIAIAGPVANALVALVAVGIIAALAPNVDLWSRPWVTVKNLLQSLVWINFGLAAVNLLPAYPLDGGRILRAWLANNPPAGTSDPWQFATRKAVNLGQGFAMFFTLLGIVGQVNIWVVLIGLCLFVAAYIEDRTLLFQLVADNVQMQDIMLTDFSTLSPADTLEDALMKAVHTLQDDFPVVRGQDLVGTVSRQKIVEALRSHGNGYVQSVMGKVGEVAQRSESLASALRKLTVRGANMIPVVDSERLVGIVTLQNLTHNMGLLAEHKRMRESGEE
jgi:Zn-dependent protease/CBS domain-containing protein